MLPAAFAFISQDVNTAWLPISFCPFHCRTYNLCVQLLFFSSLICFLIFVLLRIFFCSHPSLFVCCTHTLKHRHTDTHTMRAWLISVSLSCFRKVLEQERPSERHFNPNYVDLKTALDTWGDRRWEGGGWLHSTHEYWWTDTLSISSHGSPHGENQPINFFGVIIFPPLQFKSVNLVCLFGIDVEIPMSVKNKTEWLMTDLQNNKELPVYR